jgi:hypothetical protein
MTSNNVCSFEVIHGSRGLSLRGPVFEGIVGQSAGLRHVLDLIEAVARGRVF